MITTPDQRLRVFVSSTLLELAEERAVARAAIEGLRLVPVMFELAARAHPPQALYRSYLAQSQVFVGLYWQQYGWVGPGMTISGLADELQLATAVPRLLYVKDPAPERDPRLAELITDIESAGETSYRTFSSPDELGELLADDLAVLLSERFAAETAQSEDPVVAAVPRPATSFVGRQRELAEVEALVARDDVRLVSLTGAGGIGKSRLALEVAHRFERRGDGDVRFVPLAHVSEPALVLPSIANTLRIRADEADPGAGLVAALRRRRLLLVIDNFEQVIEAAPDLGTLLAGCPDLRLLVTSRRVLRLRGEHEYRLPPLSLPPADVRGEDDLRRSDAAELFLERAGAVRPDLHLDPQQLAAVATITRRLDGVPLATELAAARVRLLPPSALAERLDGSLSLLDGVLADLPERQQSLQATLDWSHDLLSPTEQTLFAQLSTFVDGFTLDAVEHVCRDAWGEGNVIDAVSGLLDSSLIVLDPRDAGLRFRMLNPVRDYARRKLAASGAKAEVDRRHTDYFRQLCRQAAVGLRQPEHAAWLTRLEAESGNLGSSARRCMAIGDHATVAEGTWLLWPWFWLHGHLTEAMYWNEQSLASAADLDPLLRARLQWVVGGALFEQGRYDESRPLLAAAEEGFTALGDEAGLGLTEIFTGSLAVLDGDAQRATAAFRDSVRRLRADGDRFSAIVPATALAVHLLLTGGSPQEAEALLDRARADAAAIAAPAMVDLADLYRGVALLVTGDTPSARTIFVGLLRGPEGMAHSDETFAYALEGLGAAALADEDASHAATLHGAATGLRERSGLSPWPLMRPLIEGLAIACRAALGDDAFDIAWSAGRALDRHGAMLFAVGRRDTSDVG